MSYTMTLPQRGGGGEEREEEGGDFTLIFKKLIKICICLLVAGDKIPKNSSLRRVYFCLAVESTHFGLSVRSVKWLVPALHP